ncbi:MAG: CvpA family protein [bacterium]|nr:CvpA family protein [bacterium]
MNPSLGVHFLVLALAGTMALGIYNGYRGGLIRGGFKVLGLIAGLMLARPLAWTLYPYLESVLGFPGSWFVLIFLSFLAITIAFSVVGFLLSKAIHWTPLKWVDKLGGAALGLLIGILVNGLILSMMEHTDLLADYLRIAHGWERHFLRVIVDITPDVFDKIRPIIDEVRHTIPKDVI